MTIIQHFDVITHHTRKTVRPEGNKITLSLRTFDLRVNLKQTYGESLREIHFGSSYLACVQVPPPLKQNFFLRGGGGCTQARVLMDFELPRFKSPAFVIPRESL